jgi:GT2 family glycosyltransferase
MTDDDAEVFADWIAQIKRIHGEHPEAGAVGGAVIGAASDSSFLSRVADVITFPLPTTPTYVRNLPGVNVSYKREVLDKVGPQDAQLLKGIPSGGDDVDFNWRVKKLGYEVLFHPDIKVLHHHRPNLRQFLRQHYFYGRAYYLVRRKWPEMYCVYPHHLRTPKDVLKGIHFFAAVLYQPFLYARKMPTWTDRILALPLLTLNHMVWKWGMIYQAWLVRNKGRRAY